MRCRLKLAALLVLSALLDAAPMGPAAAQVAAEQEVVALVVEGIGFGHGRGMSQWGAYGRAVNGGQSWTQILDAYYGGTTLGIGGDVVADPGPPPRPRRRLHRRRDLDDAHGAMWGERPATPRSRRGRRRPRTATTSGPRRRCACPGVVHVGMDPRRRQRRRPDHVLDDGERVDRRRPATSSACAPTTAR